MTVHGEPHLARRTRPWPISRSRLQSLRGRGLAVEVHVHERAVSDVAAALDGHTHELAADLIAMCAHGRSNLRTQLIGSIAEQILRGGSVPILLRTVRRPDGASFELRKLLVPIDFGHDVDTALTAARTLATPYRATLVLLAAPEPPAPPTVAAAAGNDRPDPRSSSSTTFAAGSPSSHSSCPPTSTCRRSSPTPPQRRDPRRRRITPSGHDRAGHRRARGLSSWYDPSIGQQLLTPSGPHAAADQRSMRSAEDGAQRVNGQRYSDRHHKVLRRAVLGGRRAHARIGDVDAASSSAAQAPADRPP